MNLRVSDILAFAPVTHQEELEPLIHRAFPDTTYVSSPSRINRASKRALDILLAAILLVLCAPIMLAVGFAVRSETRGPVIFRQLRVGRAGHLFEILKFRTMHPELSDLDADVQTARNDPRVTRVGAFLRRHSLDEVPQLINILRGDMSLVGPRPHAVGTAVDGIRLPRLIANYDARHQVRPGLTGLAQVSGLRGELDTIKKARQRVECDLEYIVNWSLRLDFIIIARTVRMVLRDRSAY